MTTAEHSILPIAGCAFEDILDGYFPLFESVRQMMERQGFTSMWITILHAPVMDIAGLALTAPVPLSLRKTYSGMVDHLTLSVTKSNDDVRLVGVGNWIWVDGRDEMDTFPAATRLGEPAFVRGIGITQETSDVNETEGRASIALVRRGAMAFDAKAQDEVNRELGWQVSRAWELGPDVPNISRVTDIDTLDVPFNGEANTSPLSVPAFMADWDYMLIDMSADQCDQQRLEVAQRF